MKITSRSVRQIFCEHEFKSNMFYFNNTHREKLNSPHDFVKIKP